MNTRATTGQKCELRSAMIKNCGSQKYTFTVCCLLFVSVFWFVITVVPNGTNFYSSSIYRILEEFVFISDWIW